MNTKFLLSSDNNNRNELLKKKIIHYYIANGDATIADLGREMDLSIPTVTKLVAELQDDGYILDFGKQETNGGRKPNIYGLNPASGYFVGVDMLKDKLNIAAIDFKGDKVQLEENIPYIVYYFNQQTNRLEIIKKYTGKNKNTETKEKLNCYICQNTVKVYKKPDKYIEAIAKLYEEENNKKQEEKKEQEKGKEIDG